MSELSSFKKALGDIFFPENYTCDICGAEIFEGHLCADCLKTVTFNDKECCPVCGRKTPNGGICIECKARIPLFKKAVSALVYGGGASALILKFKNGQAYLKEYFADLLAEKLVGFPQIDCLVYVPMTKKSIKKRGYNQSQLLAESLSKRINVPCIKNAVIKIQETTEQKTLLRKARTENLLNCFSVEARSEIKGKSVLIVDDVLTTGATADAMAKKLLGAGAKCVYLATVASVEFKIEHDKKKD